MLYFNRSSKNQFGFTLIELLVVISIIGFIASFAIYGLSLVRMKARDAYRISSIKQLQQALQLYYDKNNSYPISGNCGSTVPSSNWCNSIQSQLNNHWIRNGSSINLGEFIKSDPIDPKPISSASFLSIGNYFYYSTGYGGPGQWYMIVFNLEDNKNDFQKQDGVTACDGSYFHYGNNANGIITIGKNCQK